MSCFEVLRNFYENIPFDPMDRDQKNKQALRLFLIEMAKPQIPKKDEGKPVQQTGTSWVKLFLKGQKDGMTQHIMEHRRTDWLNGKRSD